ncbi:MAG: prolyl-tRNA synthetase associated domain-containing protein [Caulobacterales bacterium]
MPATPADLFARLDALGIRHATTEHRAVVTVEEGADLKENMPGGHTKNLFLKDKKGALFLVCAIAETKIDLNALSKVLGAGRFSFGSAELLYETLGVTPGSVTVFAVVNDEARRVHLILDAALFDHPIVNFHPLTNTATTALAPADLLRFLASLSCPHEKIAFRATSVPAPIEP